MQRVLSFFARPKIWSLTLVIGVTLLAWLISYWMEASAVWAFVLGALLLVGWAVYWLWRRHQASVAGEQFGKMLDQQAELAVRAAPNASKDDIQTLRNRMHEAIKTIRTSKLGETSGSAALYELPWYMIIGNPAAGKSSAIKNSGLKFPFSDQNGPAVQGIGGTRNCDWFFTTEGILLDTAGRYSVHDEDRTEWLGFLQLLRKNRPKAPINGIMIGVSIADLTQNKPEYAINLAKNLRQRVQELTEHLEVFAPVYILFTKMDLLAGFVDFFEDSEEHEKDRVWGATLAYEEAQKTDAVERFEEQFDVLYEGLKELSVSRMSLNRKQSLSPGLMTFPMEFYAIRPALRTFIATLFEDNPFQFKPIFRGFYFTSALQEGTAVSPLSQRMASRFSLESPKTEDQPRFKSSHGFFLRDLFSKVIFHDKNLVRQYSSRRKRQLRYATFFGSVALLGLTLGCWAWSYIGNQQLAANVQADLNKAVKLQQNRTDLASRLEALETLQDRLDQLKRYHEDTPLSLSYGLYKGDALEAKLRQEYFAGVREVMLKPVVNGIEGFLTEVNSNADRLQPLAQPISGTANAASSASAPAAAPAQPATPYKDVSPTNVEDAYNALKAYIMLANRDRIEPGHLNDQITRFWRTWLENNRGDMSREEMIRRAEKILTFTLAQTSAPDFPLVDNKLALVDQSRENLRRVVKGMPARERVYAEIKLRASSRFPVITVANTVGEQNSKIVAGSYVVSGTFTKAAWDQYVSGAIKDAATKDLQTSDWVLKTAAHDDLTLEGSPEQIQKTLTAMYKADYIKEWQKFVQGITVKDFADFNQAVESMNRLGDPALSPLYQVMETLYRETAWDNPSLMDQGLNKAKRGFVQWFKEVILRRQPANVQVNVAGGMPANTMQMGPIGREFSVVAHLMVARGESGNTSLMKTYLASLSKLRSRFNQLKNAGDFGPGSIQLMRQTLDGSGSELADALRFVDEQMLNGVPESGKATMRPMLVRPLMQAYAVLIDPAEQELNKIWSAEIHNPFSRTLATKYPFNPDSRVEASGQEIGQFFGPEGGISKFVEKNLGALVTRRGDTLSPRTWADMAVSFNSDFVAKFPRFVAPVGGAAAQGGGGAQQAQTSFQIMPIPTPGLLEYTIEIDGQVMRYRNGAQAWSNFIWPNSTPAPGVKITAVTYDGRTVELLNVPGNFGLEKMISTANRKKKADGLFELSWSSGNVAVAVDFRIISSPQATGSGETQEQGLKGLTLPPTIAGGGA